MTISSRIMTGSNICVERQEPLATSRGRFKRAAIPSRGALASLSDTGAETAVRLRAVRESGARARLQAVSAAVRKPVAGLHQSARREARPVHLLRLLRMVRVRQLFEGLAADDDSAGAHPQA